MPAPGLNSTSRSIILTQGDTRVVRRLMILGQAMFVTRFSRVSAEHAFRRPLQISRRECVGIPADITRYPFYHLKTAGAVSALKPARRDFTNLPTKSMAFHQQFDAVAKAAVGFDSDLVNDASGE